MMSKLILNDLIALVAIFGLYTIPSIITAIYFNDSLSFVIFATSVISIAVLALFSFIIRSSLLSVRADASGKKSNKIAKIIVLLFFFSYLVLVIDFGGFPAISFFLDGGNPNVLRADFTKEKDGLANIALYVRSVTLKGLLPLAFLILLESGQKKWCYFTLISFSLIAILSYEKSIILWLGAPIIIYYFLSGRFLKMIYGFCWVACVLLIVSFLQVFSNVSIISYIDSLNSQNHAFSTIESEDLHGYSDFNNSSNETNIVNHNTHLIREAYEPSQSMLLRASLSEAPNYRFALEQNSYQSSLFDVTVRKLLNRAFWIPFITSYDALLYWGLVYDESLLLFSINRHLSKLTGVGFSDIERELFRFQFGGNYDSTGNANFVYFIEGYIAFGFLGLVLYSLVFSLILGVTSGSKSAVVIASGFGPVFSLLNASLLSSLFSGGIIFYILFLFFGLTWWRKRC